MLIYNLIISPSLLEIFKVQNISKDKGIESDLRTIVGLYNFLLIYLTEFAKYTLFEFNLCSNF